MNQSALVSATLKPLSSLQQAHPRQHIVAEALTLFLHRGLQAVTMDDLAATLTMSKKTVYKWFPSKANLVQAAVKVYTGRFRTELVRHMTRSRTAMEELLTLFHWIEQQQNRQFLQELKLHFPEGWQLWLDHWNGFVCNHIRRNLCWGMLQHQYRPDLDVELLSRLWLLEVSFELNTCLHPACGLERAQVQQTMIAHFMTSIATPAGNQMLLGLQVGSPKSYFPLF